MQMQFIIEVDGIPDDVVDPVAYVDQLIEDGTDRVYVCGEHNCGYHY